jgi:endothelin-converting enzyme/putative endopeptidase
VKLLLAITLIAAALGAQDRPLASLPYTPSLEPAFIDRGVDPCVDFWRYSCGNWNKLNPIPPDQASWHVYSKLAQENLQFLWGVLEQAANPAS